MFVAPEDIKRQLTRPWAGVNFSAL